MAHSGRKSPEQWLLTRPTRLKWAQLLAQKIYVTCGLIIIKHFSTVLATMRILCKTLLQVCHLTGVILKMLHALR